MSLRSILAPTLLFTAAACGGGGSAGGALSQDGGGDAGAAGSSGTSGGSGSSGASGAAGASAAGGTGGSSGGGSGGTAGGGGTGGVEPGPCNTSLDCVGRPGTPVCNTATSTCVECVRAADCPDRHDCENERCVAACVNSLDCAPGTVCDPVRRRCVECVTTADCPNGMVCGGNFCRPACQSDNQCTPLGMLCDRVAGYCVACLEDRDCPAEQHCAAGACRDDACTEGTGRCNGNSVERCNGNGSGWLTPASCGQGATCVASGGSATCQPWVCTPGSTTCAPASEVSRTCAPDGLSFVSSDDCGARGQVCVAGACAPIVCPAGRRFCEGLSEVRTCSAKGHSSTLHQTCTSTQHCEATASGAACVQNVCTPSAPGCDGQFARTCAPDGSGWLAGGTDCSRQNPLKVCSNGDCIDPVCPPGQRYCDGQQVRSCAASGLGSTLVQTCSSTQYCDPSDTTCKTRICTADQPACDGNVATTCNANGSGYTGTRTDCGTDVCVSGACLPVVCTPNEYLCQGQERRRCNATGTGTTLVQTCGSTQYCNPATATCVAQVCTPNQPVCDGNSATTCNATGSGYTGPSTPCGAQLCNAGVCQDYLWVEDFEDGDFNGWIAGTGSYTRSVATPGANGTTRTLQLSKNAGASGAQHDGLYRTFSPGLRPTNIRWWVRPLSANYNYTAFTGGGTSSYVVFVYFTATNIVLSQPTSSTSTPYTVNTWYEFEVRNLNWTARTFDFYINGSLIRSGAVLSTTTPTQIDRVDLSNYFASTSAQWDEFRMMQ